MVLKKDETMIIVKVKTAQKLKSYALAKRESYEEIINRILILSDSIKEGQITVKRAKMFLQGEKKNGFID